MLSWGFIAGIPNTFKLKSTYIVVLLSEFGKQLSSKVAFYCIKELNVCKPIQILKYSVFFIFFLLCAFAFFKFVTAKKTSTETTNSHPWFFVYEQKLS